MKRRGTKSPETSEHEIRLVHVPGGLRGTIFRSQKTLKQRAQHLYVRDFRYGRNDFELGLQRVQTDGHVLVEQHRQRGSLGRVVPRVDPAGHVWVPAQVRRVYVEDAGSGNGSWRGRSQIGYFEQQAHGWC